jgi:hypothetical protein
MPDTWLFVGFALIVSIIAGFAIFEIIALVQNPPCRFSLRILLLAFTLTIVVLAWFAILLHSPG